MGVAQPRKRASEFKALTPKLGSRSFQERFQKALEYITDSSIVPCHSLEVMNN